MVKFAHVADVHLGGWKQQPMNDLNFQAFQKMIDTSIKNSVEFVLIAGDLFDSAYPPIETLKEAFSEFKKLYKAGIPCYIIAGSHDYSVSGRTFLDVLEKAGFCKNVFNPEYNENGEIILNPEIKQDIAIYGYPGKKSGLEVPELRKVKLNDAPGMFKIFMLHTTIDKVAGDIPVDSIETEKLPQADYYALGHVHLHYNQNRIVYPGPLFPNNFGELEDLEKGSFVLVDTNATQQVQFIDVETKPVEKVNVEIEDGLKANDLIVAELEKRNVEDKIVLLRVKGELQRGRNSDIKFEKIDEYVKNRGAFFMLKNANKLQTQKPESEIEIKDEADVEDETIKNYSEQNPSKFNKNISQLMNALSIEKQEGETNESFNSRLLDEARKILEF
ncbi:MAG: exonuclease SbcCD subunit D [Candidatus Pacearchaeota archaeon]